MDEDLENLEEKLKKKEKGKKDHKVSGRSVFKLQEIIKKKSKELKDGDGENSQTLAGDD